MIIQRVANSLNQAYSTDSSWWTDSETSLIAVGVSGGKIKIHVSKMEFTNSSNSAVYVKDISIQGLVGNGNYNYSSCRVFCSTSSLTPNQAINDTRAGVTAQAGGSVSFTFNGATRTSNCLKALNIPVNSLLQSGAKIYVYLVPASGTSCNSWVVGGSTYQDGGGVNATGIIAETIGYSLTVRYHSNGATTAKFKGTTTTADPICTETYYQYETYKDGFDNYNNTDHIYLSKTGYHVDSNEEWNTRADGNGTSVSMAGSDTNPPTGADLATRVGKNISNSNQTVNLYANWKPYKLTVNYYGNGATSGTLVETAITSPGTAKLLSVDYFYGVTYEYGLNDVQNEHSLYLERTGYIPTWQWGTTTSGGTLISQSTSYTGQALAEAFGKSIDSSNQSVDVYAQWRPQEYKINYVLNGGILASGYSTTQTVYYDDENVKIHPRNVITREGYEFLGWTTTTDGQQASNYTDWGTGESWTGTWTPLDGSTTWCVDEHNHVTLYALWKSLATMFVKTDTDTWSAGTPFVKTANGWKRAVGVFVKTDKGWKRSIR